MSSPTTGGAQAILSASSRDIEDHVDSTDLNNNSADPVKVNTGVIPNDNTNSSSHVAPAVMSDKEADDAPKNDNSAEEHVTTRETGHHRTAEAPPLPDEAIPPLPAEAPPAAQAHDDGWMPVWEESAQAYYFFNRFTGATQWTNPRVPDAPQPGPPGVTPSTNTVVDETPAASRPAGGYDPAIHGDYDPTAWYAQPAEPEEPAAPPVDPAAAYEASANFNRFTGRFQAADLRPEKFNDESKSRNQMNAFFDVDAAANSHDGRSLKAERSGKKLSKNELKQFKEKRKAKKEEKRRAWLRD